MRELTGRAQADIRKLIGGVPWIELLDVRLPDYFEPTVTEKKFLAVAPDGRYHVLVTNALSEGKVHLPTDGWQTEGQVADCKCYFAIPYERDQVADSSEKQGQMNSRVTLGDAGGVIQEMVDRCDGLYGAAVSIGFAMQDDSGGGLGLAVDAVVCHEPEVVLDFTVSRTMHDGTNFAAVLSSDTPLEWKFPARTMLKNVCHFQFKGLECGFDGNPVRRVAPERRGDGVTGLFGGHWAIIGGHVQRLVPDGATVMANVPGVDADNYLHIESAGNDYFFAVREQDNYFIYFDGTAPVSFNVTAQRVIKNAAYPFCNTISSGGDNDAYAITNTAITRYLHRFAGAVRTRIGTGQYFNIVSSPLPGLCYAIQGGAYSGTGGAFVAANSTTGRLVRVEGATITDIGDGKLWRWCSAVGYDNGEIQSIEIYAVTDGGELWLIDDWKDSGGWDTPYFSRVKYYELTGGFFQEAGDVTLPGAPECGQFSHSVTPYGHELIIIIDGVLWAGIREQLYYFNDAENWKIVSAIPKREDLLDCFSVVVSEANTYIMQFTNFDDGIFQFSAKVRGAVVGVLPLAGFNADNQALYYLAGSEVFLIERKDFATCDHTLTDCKERGNEVRFGGFPGIGSGGLTQ